jgi:hypothetical protein|tara:strand:+ start:5528 stop:5983 length:456 start_codon:yes stop_codon:yes gene_type:complete
MPLNVNRIAAPSLELGSSEYSLARENTFRSTLRLFFTELVNSVNNGVVGNLSVQPVETGTARTLTASDQNSIISFTSSSAITVTLPVNTTEELNDGFQVRLDRDGTGTLTVVAQAGATVNSAAGLTARVRYSSVTIVKTAVNLYKLTGDSA